MSVVVRSLGIIHASELNEEAESVTGEATGGFNDERGKAHKCVHLVAQDRVVPALFLLRADLESVIRRSGQNGDGGHWGQAWGGR